MLVNASNASKSFFCFYNAEDLKMRMSVVLETEELQDVSGNTSMISSEVVARNLSQIHTKSFKKCFKTQSPFEHRLKTFFFHEIAEIKANFTSFPCDGPTCPI